MRSLSPATPKAAASKSFAGRAIAALSLLAIASLGTACVVDHHASAPTEIEFDEVRNLGYYCGGPLSSWTVTNRETGDSGTAGCEQPILFTDLAPFTTYNFDITGQSVPSTCWSGSCSVSTGSQGSITYPDCSALIAHHCTL